MASEEPLKDMLHHSTEMPGLAPYCSQRRQGQCPEHSGHIHQSTARHDTCKLPPWRTKCKNDLLVEHRRGYIYIYVYIYTYVYICSKIRHQWSKKTLAKQIKWGINAKLFCSQVACKYSDKYGMQTITIWVCRIFLPGEMRQACKTKVNKCETYKKYACPMFDIRLAIAKQLESQQRGAGDLLLE